MQCRKILAKELPKILQQLSFDDAVNCGLPVVFSLSRDAGKFVRCTSNVVLY